MVKWRYIIPACVLLIVAVVLGAMQGAKVTRANNQHDAVNAATSEDARSMQRSRVRTDKGKSSLSSQEAFDRLWRIGMDEWGADEEAVIDELLAEEQKDNKLNEIEEYLQLIDYNQAYRLFEKFHMYDNKSIFLSHLKPIIIEAITIGAFYRMSELDTVKVMAILEQEEDKNVSRSMARILVTSWSRVEPSEALIWWKNYASRDHERDMRIDMQFPFVPSLDQDLYAALSKVDYKTALQFAKSEGDVVLRINALIGVVKGVSSGVSIDQVATQIMEEFSKISYNSSDMNVSLYLQQTIALKWIESDVDEALSWYQSQHGDDVEPFHNDFSLSEEDIDGDPFSRDAALVERWANEHPDSFLTWVDSRGRIDQYPNILKNYYGGQHTDKAMAFIARQKDGEQRRNLFQQVIRNKAIVVSIMSMPGHRIFDSTDESGLDLDGDLSQVLDVYDQGLENLQNSNLPNADKKELTNWLMEEREEQLKKFTSDE